MYPDDRKKKNEKTNKIIEAFTNEIQGLLKSSDVSNMIKSEMDHDDLSMYGGNDYSLDYSYIEINKINIDEDHTGGTSYLLIKIPWKFIYQNHPTYKARQNSMKHIQIKLTNINFEWEYDKNGEIVVKLNDFPNITMENIKIEQG